MSKILYACFKDSKYNTFSANNIKLLSKRLEPDNISFSPPKILENKGVVVAIFNPNDSINIHGTSICLGNMINRDSHWWKPMTRVPDGSYALFRSNHKDIEVISDMVASRTIWYYHDENIFISSTSQRAIVFFLKSFKFNRLIIPWMLATGTLGPDHSWDSRIKILRGDSSIFLERSSWRLTVKSQKCNFNPLKRSEKQHQKELKCALNDTFEAINLDYSRWVLLLSGGYDSRGILCMLKKVNDLKCITWGLECSQFDKRNDAFIAQKLANDFGIQYKYYLTETSDEPIEKILNRFLVSGEGRIDHISGYMDGFKIWKKLFEEGINGVIRGDHGFGYLPVSSELDVRLLTIPLLSDFVNLNRIQEFGINEQYVPHWLNKKDGESLELWRDRLYHQYIIPFVLAALNDLKLSYVEIINPLLTKRILSVVRNIPDELRTNKKLFKKIVDDIGPNISYAGHPATDSVENILRNKNVIDEIHKELRAEYAKSILPSEFINFILEQNHNTISSTTTLRSFIKPLVPSKLRSRIKNTFAKPHMDLNKLAFRAYIICVLNRILTTDAKIISA
jgi:hypothetical protein